MEYFKYQARVHVYVHCTIYTPVRSRVRIHMDVLEYGEPVVPCVASIGTGIAHRATS